MYIVIRRDENNNIEFVKEYKLNSYYSVEKFNQTYGCSKEERFTKFNEFSKYGYINMWMLNGYKYYLVDVSESESTDKKLSRHDNEFRDEILEIRSKLLQKIKREESLNCIL